VSFTGTHLPKMSASSSFRAAACLQIPCEPQATRTASLTKPRTGWRFLRWISTGIVSVLLVYDLLKRVDSGEGSGIEHTWNATSDTIAGWVASRLGARFIKATDVDGILQDGALVSEITARELLAMGETCVDPVLPRLLISRSLDCRVVNGRHPDRVIDAIQGVFRGTVIVGGWGVPVL